MMINIQILTPFRHQFRNKDIWLTAYEVYILDVAKEADKAELEYMLSNLFPYRDFIYIEPSALNLNIIESVKGYNGERSVQEYIEPPVKEVPVEPIIQPELKEPESLNKEAQVDRKQELEEMKAKQVRLVAESLGIEYSNKEDTIEAILNVEF